MRPLQEKDIHQSALIEREAFPTLFPPTSFSRELENRLARYFVAVSHEDLTKRGSAPRGLNPGVVGSLFRSAQNVLAPRNGPPITETGEFLVGFVGVWHMVDEAHIVSVGVRNDYRGRGVGELLLIGALEHAMASKSEVATLEVRKSNMVARNLYLKYGFKERGLRKAYYADNREDALILTTDRILESPYPENFAKLVREHQQRWGRAVRVLGSGG